MTKRRNDAEYKIDPPAPVTEEGPQPHPGPWLKMLLKEHGHSVSSAAEMLGLNRPNLSNVTNGKAAVSRDLAYKIDALVQAGMAPDERIPDFGLARLLIDMQSKHDWDADAEQRAEALKLIPTLIERAAGKGATSTA